jgi:hypothetical protein
MELEVAEGAVKVPTRNVSREDGVIDGLRECDGADGG